MRQLLNRIRDATEDCMGVLVAALLFALIFSPMWVPMVVRVLVYGDLSCAFESMRCTKLVP